MRALSPRISSPARARAGARNAVAFALLLASGCSGNDFDEVSEVQGVRVLAVRPEAPQAEGMAEVPASGLPGQTLELEMLYMDGRASIDAVGAPAATQPNLAWMAGCHNPPSRFYYGCSAEEGVFGTELPIPVPLPDDILSSAPLLDSDPFHFGVSFVFFGVCSGRIEPRPGREGIPLDCVDETTQKSLGAKDFVVGFTTLYTYEGVQNLNPELLSVRFDGNDVAGPFCTEEAPCAAPTVAACKQGEDCPEHRIVPELSDASFEHTQDGVWEILWTSYYATQGELAKESQLASDRVTGRVTDFTSGWRAPSTPGIVRLWVTVNDERGGAHWRTFDVIVE